MIWYSESSTSWLHSIQVWRRGFKRPFLDPDWYLTDTWLIWGSVGKSYCSIYCTCHLPFFCRAPMVLGGSYNELTMYASEDEYRYWNKMVAWTKSTAYPAYLLGMLYWALEIIHFDSGSFKLFCIFLGLANLALFLLEELTWYLWTFILFSRMITSIMAIHEHFDTTCGPSI